MRKPKMQISENHPYAQWVEECLRALGFPNCNFRHYDLTETTQEPGNTALFISYVEDPTGNALPPSGHLKPSDFFRQLEAQLLSIEGQGGMGTYEDVHFIQQNNEFIIIINSNL